MQCHPPLKSQHSSFEDDTSVHPWDCLVDHLINDIDEDTYLTLLQLSRDKLKVQVYGETFANDRYAFFTHLENQLSKEGAVKYLETLMEHTNLHGEMGDWF